MKIPRRIHDLLERWVNTKGPRTQSTNEEIDCELCNDAAWWPAHGYSEAERQFFCGPAGIDCPGFGGDPQN